MTREQEIEIINAAINYVIAAQEERKKPSYGAASYSEVMWDALQDAVENVLVCIENE